MDSLFWGRTSSRLINDFNKQSILKNQNIQVIVQH